MGVYMKKSIFLFTLLFLICGATFSVTAEGINNKMTRLGGADRIETAIKVADQYNSGMLQSVVLSTANDFPDALSGGVFAAKVNAPILLTGKTIEDSKKTLDYIEGKLSKDGTVYIFGGKGVVNEDILNYLKTKGYINFVRLGGADRYETNSLITAGLNVVKGTPIMLVNSMNFPDALSISSIAAIKAYPIVITDPGSLSESAKVIINNILPSQVYVIDGEGVFNKKIESDLKAILPADSSLIKLYGTNRYESSLKVCDSFNLKTTNYVLATGDSFPDGITGSVLAAKLNAPILLVNEANIKKQNALLFGKGITDTYILGGPAAVSTAIEESFSTAATGFDCASSRTFAEAKMMKELGYSFVARYYFEYDKSVAWKKNLTLKEAKDISSAGLDIVAVYQDGGKDNVDYFTYDQGVKDCKKAIKNASEVGQPSGTPIYFAVDSAAENKDLLKVEAYFDGVKSTMTSDVNDKWGIGVYGSYSVVNDIYAKLGTNTYIWQTPAWSKGNLSANYNIYQAQINLTEHKISIDLDKANVSKGNDVGGFQVP